MPALHTRPSSNGFWVKSGRDGSLPRRRPSFGRERRAAITDRPDRAHRGRGGSGAPRQAGRDAADTAVKQGVSPIAFAIGSRSLRAGRGAPLAHGRSPPPSRWRDTLALWQSPGLAEALHDRFRDPDAAGQRRVRPARPPVRRAPASRCRPRPPRRRVLDRGRAGWPLAWHRRPGQVPLPRAAPGPDRWRALETARRGGRQRRSNRLLGPSGCA